MRWYSTIVMLGLLGCSNGVPQEKYDAVVKERDALQSKVDALGEKLKSSSRKRMDALSNRKKAVRKGPDAAKVDAWLKDANITRDSKLQAVIKTNQGDIQCDLWPKVAPLTVANFVGLAEGTREWTDPKTKQKTKKPLYDGTVFHRIIKGFMIQGGDPMGTGRGGPGYRFEDEVNTGKSFDELGILAMANSGPGTNGSQFFITDGLTKWLDNKHTIFGKCDTTVPSKLAQVEVSKAGNRPVEEVTIKTIKIKRL